MASTNSGIQAGQTCCAEIPLSATQTGEKTWPDLVFEFLFPGIEVLYDVA